MKKTNKLYLMKIKTKLKAGLSEYANKYDGNGSPGTSGETGA